MTNQYPSFEDDALVEGAGMPERQDAHEDGENAGHAHRDDTANAASRTPRAKSGKSGKPRGKASSTPARSGRRPRVERDGIIHLPRPTEAAAQEQLIESDRAQSELEAQG